MEFDEATTAQIPQEVRDHPFVKDAPDLPTLLKNAVETKNFVGRSIQLPPKDGKPEDFDNWRKEQNAKLVEHGHLILPKGDMAPESADKYEIKWSDGVAIPQESETNLRKFALENGVNNSTLQKFVDFYGGMTKQALSQAMVTAEAADTELKTMLGADYTEVTSKVQAGKEALKEQFGLPDTWFDEVISDTQPDGTKKFYPVGKHPNIIGFLEMIGGMSQGDQAGNTARLGGEGLSDIASVDARIKSIMDQPDYKKNYAQYEPQVKQLFERKAAMMGKQNGAK